MLYSLVSSQYKVKGKVQKVFTEMKLHEIIKELTEKRPDGSRHYTQETLAVKLKTNQPTISQMKTGVMWQEHWELFLRLLPLCRELGLDPARDLKEWPTAAEVIAHVEQHAETTRKDASQGKNGTKKESSRPVPPRRGKGRATNGEN